MHNNLSSTFYLNLTISFLSAIVQGGRDIGLAVYYTSPYIFNCALKFQIPVAYNFLKMHLKVKQKRKKEIIKRERKKFIEKNEKRKKETKRNKWRERHD